MHGPIHRKRRFARFVRLICLDRLLSPPNLLLAVVSIFIFSEQRAIAQQGDTAQQAVNWEFRVLNGSDGNPMLVFHARIHDGWKLYSTTNPDTLGYSRVTLDSSSHAKILGIEEKGALQRKKDPIFNGSETNFFTGDAQWLVHVRPGTGDLKGVVTFIAVRNDNVVGPTDVPFRYGHSPGGGWIVKSSTLQQSAGEANELRKTSIDLANPVNSCGGTGTEGSKGFVAIFFLGMLGGLIGLVMPCTFPMIPLTVSFFIKQSGSRRKAIGNASLYGFFIFIIYLLISVPFYFLKAKDANILNNISTNVGLNIFFGTIFLLFALSFFGLFEITLPSRFSNSVDSKSSIGTIGGIFFMALTLAIVSFSCTGPILGTLLVGALGQNGGAVQLTVAMAGFGLALGLPFALFALFPRWLQSLPRSGSWMNTVKITFAFIELAVALKYFSSADLVNQWGLLKRETFFGLWIAIGFALVFYLLGLLKFPHDPPPKKLGRPRVIIAGLFLLFVLYLVPGVTNTRYANRPLVAGFPPPLFYSVYKHDTTGRVEANFINDYNKALVLAKQENKPILIDFTGWACVNCRKMEENVWPKRGVKELIKNDYILVSLYVDDRKRLPDDQQFSFPTSDGSVKDIHTIGDKFSTLQSENFKNASQPLYVVISPDEKLMTKPVGYTPDPGEYAQWLQCGLDAFHRQHSTASR
ncbi:MAG TPA: cytochrome c biogenesis protein CcdA [Puia sp.]|jgi:thiol:disulfide interchange protein DsbD|nr:cytochrome c biogenesis protein CcdA [Puia sp.]